MEQDPNFVCFIFAKKTVLTIDVRRF